MTILSIVAGTYACNAKCPFCVAHMTPSQGTTYKKLPIDERNFRKACQFARDNHVSTAMITSKGEATLFPDQVSRYMEILNEYSFPLIEIQTNGIEIEEQKVLRQDQLARWYDLGMTMISLSITHYEPEMNRRIYMPHREHYIDLPKVIKKVHDNKIGVRLSCVLADGWIDDASKLEKLVLFSKENAVEQLTVRPVTKPEESENKQIYEWVKEHQLTDQQISDMMNYVSENGKLLQNLDHGAQIYDIQGQNICFSNCLTLDINKKPRQYIFFPDGKLCFDWQYRGARIL